MAMACSAVVMEFPNGVFITTMPFGGRWQVNIVNANTGASNDFHNSGGLQHRRGRLSRGTHCHAVIFADNLDQLIALKAGNHININPAFLKISSARGLILSAINTLGMASPMRQNSG